MQKFKGFPTKFRVSPAGFGKDLRPWILGDKLAIGLIALWFLPLIICLVYAFLNYKFLSREIPLLYSRIWGENQLAPKNYIFLPIWGSFILGLFNIFLSYVFRETDKIYKYLLLASGAIVSILASITVIEIIELIT